MRTGASAERMKEVRAHRTYSREDRATLFWRHVTKGDGCWEWSAARNVFGYGVFSYRTEGKRSRTLHAHRYAWEITNGPIASSETVVRHRCDNPACVRPDHLELGTQLENQRDKAERGRARNSNAGRTHCRRGHPFSDENTYINGNGARVCRTCFRARRKKYRNARHNPEHIGAIVARVLTPILNGYRD